MTQPHHPRVRLLEVIRAAQVTPRMSRVTLGGEEMADIEPGPNVKILLPPAGLGDPEWPVEGPDGEMVWPAGDRRPTTRTYSVRRLDRVAGELDVDFVLHEGGVASMWAAQARPGDVVGMGGPGGLVVRDADWYLLAGDHTALPAIARILEDLPAAARGHALVEVPDAGEEQDLRFEAGFELTWLHSGTATGATTLLADAVRHLTWPADERVFAWVGAESAAVRAIRSHLRHDRGLTRREHLAIGYWHRAMDETAYHEAHDNDRDQDYYDTMHEEHDDHAHPHLDHH